MSDYRCPFCSSEKYHFAREFDVSDLSAQWLWSFGFDPFISYPLVKKFSKVQCKDCDLIYFHPQVTGDEELYRNLMKLPWYHETDKWEFDEALKLIEQHKPKRLLEVGCANGNFLEKVKNKISYSEGIELNKELVHECLSKKLNVTSTPLDEINSRFDMIVLFQVLEHLEDPQKSIRQIMNLLNENGIVIISVPNPESFLKNIESTLMNLPPHHVSGWYKSTFNFMATKYRLRQLYYNREPLRYMHYCHYRNEKLLIKHGTSGLFTQSLIKKMRRVAERFIQSKFYYFNYLMERNSITGQTHLIALIK